MTCLETREYDVNSMNPKHVMSFTSQLGTRKQITIYSKMEVSTQEHTIQYKFNESTIIFNTLSFIHITFILHRNIQLESNQIISRNRNIIKKRLNMILILFIVNLQTKHKYITKHEN